MYTETISTSYNRTVKNNYFIYYFDESEEYTEKKIVFFGANSRILATQPIRKIVCARMLCNKLICLNVCVIVWVDFFLNVNNIVWHHRTYAPI